MNVVPPGCTNTARSGYLLLVDGLDGFLRSLGDDRRQGVLRSTAKGSSWPVGRFRAPGSFETTPLPCGEQRDGFWTGAPHQTLQNTSIFDVPGPILCEFWAHESFCPPPGTKLPRASEPPPPQPLRWLPRRPCGRRTSGRTAPGWQPPCQRAPANRISTGSWSQRAVRGRCPWGARP